MADPIQHNDIIEIDATIRGIKDIIRQLEKLQAEMKKTARGVIAFQKGQDPSKKPGRNGTKKATDETQKLIQQNQKLSNSLKDLTKEQIRLKKARQDMMRETRRQIQIMDSSKGSLDRNRVALQKLTERYGRAAPEAARKMEGRVRSLTNTISKQERAIGRHQRNVGNYKSVLGSATKMIKTFGAGMIGATAAIGGFSRLMRAAKTASEEFEKGFVTVLTLLDKAQISEFGGMLKIGADEVIKKYGLAVDDASKALFDVISAGVEAGDAIEFLDAAARLAIGGNSDLSSVVLGVTKIMNAYALESSDAVKITEALFAAQKVGQTTVQELGVSIGTTTGIASQAGVGFDELLSVFAVLTKRLKNTDEAATAITATITALMKADKMPAVSEAFKKAGIEAGTAALQQNGLFETLVQITNATADDIDVLTELIPNIRALKGVGALTTEALIEYDNTLKLINNETGAAVLLTDALTMQMNTHIKTLDVRKSIVKSQLRQDSRGSLLLNALIGLTTKRVQNQIEFNKQTGEGTVLINDQNEANTENLEIQTLLEEIEEKRQARIAEAAAAEARKKTATDALKQSKLILSRFALETAQIEADVDAFVLGEERKAESAEERTEKAIALEKKFANAKFKFEQSALEKSEKTKSKFALLDQARSLSETIIALATGQAKTLSIGFPQNIPAIIGYISQIGGLLPLIKGVKFEKGGHGVLDGPSHSQGGIHIPGVGEGQGEEYFGIINRQMTKRYSQELPAIFDSLNSGKFHDVWSNANIQLQTNIDPWTKKIYDTLQSTPNIYTDSNGDTIKEYPDGYMRVIKRA